jgi:glycosyltransferase involved in cell wall biosynthesis
MRIGYDAKRAFQNFTGLGNYSRDLIKNIIENFDENEYWLYAPRILNHPITKSLEELKNVHFKSPQSSIDKTFKSLWRSVNLEKELKNDGIEIFHGLSNEIPIRKKSSNVKYVVTIHDLIFKRFPRNYKAIDRRIYNTKFKYACKKADKIIAISQQTKQDIIDFYGIQPSKIEVIYQTCHENFKKTYTEEIKNHIRDKFELPEKFILNVGTIETRKNLNAIIQALCLMQNETPLVVVGRSTRYMNFLKVQMAKLKINHNKIIFLKNVSIEELPSIYQMASVFVYPSFFEGFGIPIIEALYSGTPVITTKGSCFPEAGGPDSIYINPEDFQELADKIDLVISNKNLSNEMSLRGKNYVQKFDSLKLAQQVMGIYNQLKN